MTDRDIHPCLVHRVVAAFILALVMGAVALFGGCATAACAAVEAIEAAPAPEASGLPGLLVRMGRELLLTTARARCSE